MSFFNLDPDVLNTSTPAIADLYNQLQIIKAAGVGLENARAVSFQGFWNATTNTPAIPTASVYNKGYYYIVSVSGNTNVDGITDWIATDWIVSNGTTWNKVDNTDAVSSVAGKVGAVTLVKADVGLSNVDNTSDIDKPISTDAQTALDLKANLSAALFTGNLGYHPSLRGSVTQTISKTTSVTLNALTGLITTHNDTLGANSHAMFTLNNSYIAAEDVVVAHRQSGGTAGAYTVHIDSVSTGSCVIDIHNTNGGALGETVTIKFIIIKG